MRRFVFVELLQDPSIAVIRVPLRVLLILWGYNCRSKCRSEKRNHRKCILISISTLVHLQYKRTLSLLRGFSCNKGIDCVSFPGAAWPGSTKSPCKDFVLRRPAQRITLHRITCRTCFYLTYFSDSINIPFYPILLLFFLHGHLLSVPIVTIRVQQKHINK